MGVRQGLDVRLAGVNGARMRHRHRQAQRDGQSHSRGNKAIRHATEGKWKFWRDSIRPQRVGIRLALASGVGQASPYARNRASKLPWSLPRNKQRAGSNLPFVGVALEGNSSHHDIPAPLGTVITVNITIVQRASGKIHTAMIVFSASRPPLRMKGRSYDVSESACWA